MSTVILNCFNLHVATSLPSHKDTGIEEIATHEANGSVCWRSKTTKSALRSVSCVHFSQTLTELRSADTHPNIGAVEFGGK